MPNYTVYISSSNDADFKAEDNKSGLVNELLDSHYSHSRKMIALVDGKEKVITSAADLIPSFEKNPTAAPIVTERNKDMSFCKHGAVKGLCKKGCK